MSHPHTAPTSGARRPAVPRAAAPAIPGLADCVRDAYRKRTKARGSRQSWRVEDFAARKTDVELGHFEALLRDYAAAGHDPMELAAGVVAFACLLKHGGRAPDAGAAHDAETEAQGAADLAQGRAMRGCAVALRDLMHRIPQQITAGAALLAAIQADIAEREARASVTRRPLQ